MMPGLTKFLLKLARLFSKLLLHIEEPVEGGSGIWQAGLEKLGILLDKLEEVTGEREA